MSDVDIDINELADIIDGHVGRDEAITSDELAASMGITEDHDTNPDTRQWINELRERGWPILSGPQGYWLPADQQEVEDVVETLLADAESTRRRARQLWENWEDWHRRRRDHGVEHPQVPEHIREQIEADPVLTIDDWLEQRGGEA